MKSFLAFAAIIAGALAGQEDGGGGFTVPNYGSATAQISSYMPAPAMASMMSSMSSSMYLSMSSSMKSSMAWQSWSMSSSTKSSTAWQSWSMTSTMATPTAVAMTSMTASPSLMTITSVATAQATGWPSSPMASHTVLVGGSSLVYTPPALSGVQDKDTIIFLFLEVNHTLTQSSFASPCMAEGGFKSGFMPSDGTHIPFILVEFIDVMHTGSPLWFYCGQADHCEQGMRFSINAPGDKDMAWRALDTLTSTKTSSIATSSMKTSSMAMATASVVPGMGTIMNGQCMCDCFCGVSAFPAGAGMGMMGGLPGMIPAASGPTMATPMSSGMAYTSGAAGWK